MQGPFPYHSSFFCFWSIFFVREVGIMLVILDLQDIVNLNQSIAFCAFEELLLFPIIEEVKI
jgi:hypothetical protein